MIIFIGLLVAFVFVCGILIGRRRSQAGVVDFTNLPSSLPKPSMPASSFKTVVSPDGENPMNILSEVFGKMAEQGLQNAQVFVEGADHTTTKRELTSAELENIKSMLMNAGKNLNVTGSVTSFELPTTVTIATNKSSS
jgi:hypothetical protein